jgi:hypothetical protein
MDPAIQPHLPEQPPAEPVIGAASASEAPFSYREVHAVHPLRRVFLGSQGLRAGWSAAAFLALTILFMFALGSAVTLVVKHLLHVKTGEFTPATAIIQESIMLLAILGSGLVMASIEGRRILDYNLAGPRRIRHFFSGLAAGFVALSALVAALAWGGWLQFGPVALTGAAIFAYALLWGLAFLLTGLFEEGSARCYMLFTLARGINFWWALGTVALCCSDLLLRTRGNGVWGVYAAAAAGVLPCLILHRKKSPGAGFWQAAWVTSTLFAYLHTTNNGENWIGIFAAALVGFIFCVSVRLTGSVWWAIGCHAAWDWAESYFYGTADSGILVTGHFLTSHPAGNALCSGGADGPEGSILILGVLLLLLLTLLLVYGRRPHASPGVPATVQTA